MKTPRELFDDWLVQQGQDPVEFEKKIWPKYSAPERDLINGIRAEMVEYPIFYFKPQDQQEAFINNVVDTQIAALGGNRSGKTLGGCARAIKFSVGYAPWLHPKHKAYWSPIKPPTYGWIVSQDFDQSREVTQEAIEDYMPASWIKKWDRRLNRVELFNGSIIGFKSCESKVKKFQGAGLNWVWFDEEPPQLHFEEIMIRSKSTALYSWLTETPTEGMTWTYPMIFKDDSIPKYILHTEKNPHREPDVVDRIKKMFRHNPQIVQMRLHGDYVELIGSYVFDHNMIYKLREGCRNPSLVGDLVKIQNRIEFVQRNTGDLRIWELPKPGSDYVIGGDVARGYETGDYSYAPVIEVGTGRHVASYHGHLHPERFGDVMMIMGYYYNNAELIPEVNGQGLVTVTQIIKSNYPNIFKRMRLDRDLGETEDPGYLTNPKSKMRLISAIRSWLNAYDPRDDRTCTRDVALVNELAAYVVKDSSKLYETYGPSAGQHDDRVMGLGLALISAKLFHVGVDDMEPEETYNWSPMYRSDLQDLDNDPFAEMMLDESSENNFFRIETPKEPYMQSFMKRY